MIFASHFSFGSGGGVPAIGCGRGRVTRAAAVFAVGRLAINKVEKSERGKRNDIPMLLHWFLTTKYYDHNFNEETNYREKKNKKEIKKKNEKKSVQQREGMVLFRNEEKVFQSFKLTRSVCIIRMNIIRNDISCWSFHRSDASSECIASPH